MAPKSRKRIVAAKTDEKEDETIPAKKSNDITVTDSSTDDIHQAYQEKPRCSETNGDTTTKLSTTSTPIGSAEYSESVKAYPEVYTVPPPPRQIKSKKSRKPGQLTAARLKQYYQDVSYNTIRM